MLSILDLVMEGLICEHLEENVVITGTWGGRGMAKKLPPPPTSSSSFPISLWHSWAKVLRNRLVREKRGNRVCR